MPDFDDPFKPSDSTVIRPRPGAGRRSPSESAPARPPMPAAPHAEPLSAAALDSVGLGLGPLVRAASSLLLLTGQLRGTLAGPDVPSLRRHALDEVRRFEDRARANGIQNETVLAARYALCAALDEAVLSTPWGAQSEWTQQSLLVALHREAWGGEKFFEMLDRVASDPKHHIDLMEVQYLCLAMGFAGKYQVANRGQSQLLDIQHDLFRKIREYRGAPPTELSPRWKGIQDKRNPLIRYVPWWVVGVAVLAVLAVVFTMYRSWLGFESEEASKALSRIQVAQAPIQVRGGGLRDYLSAEEGRGELTFGNNGAKVVLTDFFASGSNRVENPAARATLEAVCRALNNFERNAISVVGHTDDQPPSRRFLGNMDLSRQRAAHVAGILRDCLETNQNRVTFTGRGDLDAFGPNTGGDYRARSRRVEIILGGGS